MILAWGWCTSSLAHCRHSPEWKALANAVGHPEWITDPRFETAALRMRNFADRRQMVGETLTERTSAEWLERSVELFPAPSERAHSLFRDGHVRLEGTRRDARVVVVVDADAVLLFGLAERLKRNLARSFTVEVREEAGDEGASHECSASWGDLDRPRSAAVEREC